MSSHLPTTVVTDYSERATDYSEHLMPAMSAEGLHY